MNTIIPTGGPAATMTSREIAELTGKELAHVHRDIRAMLDELKKDDPDLDHPQEDKDSRGYTVCFHLNRELTETLLTGYSASARLKVIRRWHELENKSLAALPDFSNPVAAARAWADQMEKAQVLAIERDHAIATKAQIGSKREATAMATASAAKREANRLKEELGFNQRHATIIAVENALGIKFDGQFWRNLKRWCDSHGITAAKVVDPRWGEVRAWPAEAWKEVQGVDLASIFPSQPGLQS